MESYMKPRLLISLFFALCFALTVTGQTTNDYNVIGADSFGVVDTWPLFYLNTDPSNAFARVGITNGSPFATTNLLTATSNTLAVATQAITNGLPTTAYVETARTNSISTNVPSYAVSSGYTTNAGAANTALYALTSGYSTNSGFADQANTATNALQLGGLAAAGYSTINYAHAEAQSANATNKVASAAYADSAGTATNCVNCLTNVVCIYGIGGGSICFSP
jgi:hypothetical protein